MEIRKLLQIGVGKTGNILLNDMMNLDDRYVGLFINSAKKDMINLDNYTEDNSFAIPQTEGAGRDRVKARGYILKWKGLIAELISNYDDYDTIVVYFSMDGGTGSGSAPTLIHLIKTLFKEQFGKDVTTIAVGVMPKTNISVNGLKNTQECWNDIITLMNNHLDADKEIRVDEYGEELKPSLDTLYLIDNNKRETYQEINGEATEALHLAFNFNTLNTNGDIDKNDSASINKAQGYNLLLRLDAKDSDNLENAIINARENSVFVLPDKDYYNAAELGIAVKSEYFNANDVETIIGSGSVNTFIGEIDEEDEETGVLFFGGMQNPPMSAIKTISKVVADKDKEAMNNEEEDISELIVTVKRNAVNKRTNRTSTTVKTGTKPGARKKVGGRKSKGVISDDMFNFN